MNSIFLVHSYQSLHLWHNISMGMVVTPTLLLLRTWRESRSTRYRQLSRVQATSLKLQVQMRIWERTICIISSLSLKVVLFQMIIFSHTWTLFFLLLFYSSLLYTFFRNRGCFHPSSILINGTQTKLLTLRQISSL